MLSNQEKPIIKRKHCLIILLGLGLTVAGTKAFSQTPPPPPPPPGEVLNRINPFKKKKAKDTVKKVDTAKANKANQQGPKPPPNPLNLFKKKKKDTTKA